MVKLIMGLKGSGKTKQLVQDINESVKNETGSMVCIEKGTKLRYDIDIRVRLIDYQEYMMGSLPFLKGFISGLHAGNFDISHIFIDSLYKVAGSKDPDEAEAFLRWCAAFGESHGVDFTITVTDDPKTAPYCISRALIAAARGDWENGLFFCGANAGKVSRLSTVREQMDQIMREWRAAQ